MRLILGSTLLLLGIAALVLRPDLAGLRAALDTAQGWAAAHPVLAPAGYAAAYAAAAALSLPIATALSLGAGALFGLPLGVAVVVAGASVGATGAMLIGRYLLRDWARARFGARLPQRSDSATLLALRLFPAAPFFVVNLAYGLTAMRAVWFGTVTAVGIVPATALTVAAGTQIETLRSLRDLARPEVLAILTVMAAIAGAGHWWQARRTATAR